MVLKGCFQFKYEIFQFFIFWLVHSSLNYIDENIKKRNRNAYTFFVQEQWAEINKTRTTKMTQSLFGKISKVAK